MSQHNSTSRGWASHMARPSGTILHMTDQDLIAAQTRLLAYNLDRALRLQTRESWATFRSTLDQLEWFKAQAAMGL